MNQLGQCTIKKVQCEYYTKCPASATSIRGRIISQYTVTVKYHSITGFLPDFCRTGGRIFTVTIAICGGHSTALGLFTVKSDSKSTVVNMTVNFLCFLQVSAP